MSGGTCGEQSVEAGPEDPENDGAQEREEITGVSGNTGHISQATLLTSHLSPGSLSVFALFSSNFSQTEADRQTKIRPECVDED